MDSVLYFRYTRIYIFRIHMNTLSHYRNRTTVKVGQFIFKVSVYVIQLGPLSLSSRKPINSVGSPSQPENDKLKLPIWEACWR